ncbi:hypothetical protein [Paenibacillus kandeliae]|uniref:hypothetical protein n=1 Tax=Paenibacillus kandeliae TaxID=3231269 RepID=UPI00345A47DE
MRTLISIIQPRLEQGQLLSDGLWELLDQQAYLEYRDSADFDTAWIHAYQKLHRDGLKPVEQEQVTEWSRLAFEQVIRGSGSADLAAYIADDVDLIFCAYLLGLEDEFVHWLAACYAEQRLPA